MTLSVVTLDWTLSLGKHLEDIASTPTLIQSDLKCFTETQFLPFQYNLDLPVRMNGFYITHKSIDRRFCSFIMCYHGNFELLSPVKINEFSILIFQKPYFF